MLIDDTTIIIIIIIGNYNLIFCTLSFQTNILQGKIVISIFKSLLKTQKRKKTVSPEFQGIIYLFLTVFYF